MRTWFTILVAMVLVRPLLAQHPDNCRSYMLIVNVRDAHGRLVTGLTSENFRAWAKRKSISVTSVQMETGPRRGIILLDVSGSMGASKSKWQAALLVAREIVLSSPAEDQIRLLTFAEEIDPVGNVSSTREALLDRIRGMKQKVTSSTKFQTSLADAISTAAHMLLPTTRGDSIWVITDGEDTQSRIKLAALERQLTSANIRLFPLIVQSHKIYGMNYDPQDFMDLANATGGISLVLSPGLGPVDTYDLRTESALRLADSVREIVSQHRSFYLLEIEMQQSVTKRQQWILKVVDTHGMEVRGTTVVYPRVLQACPVG